MHKSKTPPLLEVLLLAGAKGFEPSIFSVTGRRVNRATPRTHARFIVPTIRSGFVAEKYHMPALLARLSSRLTFEGFSCYLAAEVSMDLTTDRDPEALLASLNTKPLAEASKQLAEIIAPWPQLEATAVLMKHLATLNGEDLAKLSKEYLNALTLRQETTFAFLDRFAAIASPARDELVLFKLLIRLAHRSWIEGDLRVILRRGSKTGECEIRLQKSVMAVADDEMTYEGIRRSFLPMSLSVIHRMVDKLDATKFRPLVVCEQRPEQITFIAKAVRAGTSVAPPSMVDGWKDEITSRFVAGSVAEPPPKEPAAATFAAEVPTRPHIAPLGRVNITSVKVPARRAPSDIAATIKGAVPRKIIEQSRRSDPPLPPALDARREETPESPPTTRRLDPPSALVRETEPAPVDNIDDGWD